MTNNIDTTANIANTTVAAEELWDLHLASLDAAGVVSRAPAGSLESGLQQGTARRRSYESWLFRRLEEAQDAFEVDFLLNEIERVADSSDESSARIGQQVAGLALHRWGARYSMEEALLEYGCPLVEEPPMLVEGDTWETGYTTLLDQAEQGPDLCKIREVCFEKKADAQAFVNRTRKAFKAGDHSKQVVRCETRSGHEAPFVALVLEADLNWDDRLPRAASRDRRVEEALRRVETARNRSELEAVARVAKKMARDNQVLNSGHTHVPERGKLTDPKAHAGIGLDYRRFATVMNAVAERAGELGLTGFRTYEVKEFPARPEKDGDIFNHAARQGEFVALEIAEPIGPSLRELEEKTWKPSRELEPSPISFYTPVGDVIAWQKGYSITWAYCRAA